MVCVPPLGGVSPLPSTRICGRARMKKPRPLTRQLGRGCSAAPGHRHSVPPGPPVRSPEALALALTAMPQARGSRQGARAAAAARARASARFVVLTPLSVGARAESARGRWACLLGEAEALPARQVDEVGLSRRGLLAPAQLILPAGGGGGHGLCGALLGLVRRGVPFFLVSKQPTFFGGGARLTTSPWAGGFCFPLPVPGMRRAAPARATSVAAKRRPRPTLAIACLIHEENKI